jgi:hypothetical protein
MNFQSFRHLIIAVTFLGLPWAALSQTRTSTTASGLITEKNSPQSAELGDSLSYRAVQPQELTEMINDESAILLELRRGLERLNKACVPNLAPKSEAENALLSRNALAFEQGLAAVEARRDAQQRATALLDAASRRQTAQQCTGMGSGAGLNFFKSSRCQEAETLQSNVTAFRTQLERYYRLQSDRYKTFIELVQTERQACVRLGFSTRLLQANQVHMRESEQQSQRRIERWTRELAKPLGVGGDQP